MNKQETRRSRPAHVGLNAHLLSLSEDYRGAGINRYIYNLLRHLPEENGHHRYTAFLGDRRFATHQPSSLQLRFSRLPTVRPLVRIFWEQVIQPLEMHRHNVDLLHAMAFVSPLLSHCPSVVTVYDLSFLRFPGRFPRAKRVYLTYFTSLSVRKAERVIAISRSTKEDLIKLFGLPPDKVDVAYPGVEDRFRPLEPEEVGAFRQQHSLPSRFILFLGTLEPRKNLGSLIRAYAQLRKRGQFPHTLVLAGAKGWFYEQVFTLVEELKLQDCVLFPGFVPANDLPLWYNSAELFVYPSVYEGFGLPPLEAMACGTPVITSHTSSMPEVVGSAGLLVDPSDVDDLTHVMAAVLRREDVRGELSRRGRERAAEFTWTRTVEETVKAYAYALNEEEKEAEPMSGGEEVSHA